jgi:hypothetical protein
LNSLVNCCNRLNLLTLEAFSLQIDLLVLFFNVDDNFDELSLFFLKYWSFFAKLSAVVLHFSHRGLYFFKAFVVTLLNFNYVVLSLFEQGGKHTERP